MRTPSGSGNISASNARRFQNGSLPADRDTVMTAQVLIYDVRGEQYRALLGKRFAAVTFNIGHTIPEVENVIGDIDAIFGLGHHIPPALIGKAKNLKWVQALTTGTETLTVPGVLPPHVVLTSTRGI